MNTDKKTNTVPDQAKNVRQGNDQFLSEEEKNKKGKLTMEDLRGKKVDGFPDTEEDPPLQKNENKK